MSEEREPFVTIPVWLMRHRVLSADAKVTYGFFAEKAFRARSKTVEIPMSQLCAELGVSKPTLLKRVAELETVGALTVERGWSDRHNVKAVNRYTLHDRPFGEAKDSDVYRSHAAPYARTANTTPPPVSNTTPLVGGQQAVTKGGQRGLTEKRKKIFLLEEANTRFGFVDLHAEEASQASLAPRKAADNETEARHLAVVTPLPLQPIAPQPDSGRKRRPADDFFDIAKKLLSNASDSMAAKAAHAAVAAGFEPDMFERLCRVLRGMSPKAATAPNAVKVLGDPNHEARLKLDEVAGHLDNARQIVLTLRDNPACRLGADPFAAQLVFAELLARRWTAGDIESAALGTSTWTVAALGVTRDRLAKAEGPKPWEQPKPAYHQSLEERAPLPEPSIEERERILSQMEQIQADLRRKRQRAV